MRTPLLVAFALLGTVPGGLAAQITDLRTALARAESAAYGNRMAAGRAEAEAGSASASLRGLLPTVRVEGGYVGTNEPLSAFGMLLRQRAVTPEAFDPARLNYPENIGNVAAATILEQPLINADAWFGRRAALSAAGAARASAEWERTGTAVSVVRGWYGAILARELTTALDTALASARAHQRQAESMHRNELVTRSDALLAAVRTGEVEARLLAAQGEADLARTRLAIAIGVPRHSVSPPGAELPPAAALRAFVAADTLAAEGGDGAGGRADIRAARLAASAASLDARRATAALLPRVNAFGRLDWNSADAPFGGGESWTAGVMVSWTPFSGGAALAERRAAGGRRAMAAAASEAAVAQGTLELEAAETAVRVALATMDIAERGVVQSVEAHRIVARKYEGGVATVTDLFDAAAAETAARLAFAGARYQLIIAAAERRRASGRDISALASLEGTE